LYSGPAPVAEYDAEGELTTRFVYAGGGSAPDYMVRDGRRYRYIKDVRGSPILLVDVESGGLRWRRGALVVGLDSGWAAGRTR
jgi:hypothetical protein